MRLIFHKVVIKRILTILFSWSWQDCFWKLCGNLIFMNVFKVCEICKVSFHKQKSKSGTHYLHRSFWVNVRTNLSCNIVYHDNCGITNLCIKDCPMRYTSKWIKLWESRTMVDLICKQESQDFFWRNFSSQRTCISNSRAVTLT